ncbi:MULTISPECIES: FadR/GntR family transcriptional regulator [Kribbella]|jgi:DNA-binding FadR family transcriptional regulator|uniref:GntR family transcriptional regulator n=1 Tax=Kribbella pratensis TaxID=2512112 RepID=A0ABY2FPH2_9ACTN|nr:MULTISPECIES: FCD domain-containing protein [Kribbella]TDW95026.1 GntR family transcriptional regulator [Kribbella pratensis]TDX03638.1 GntR family transcriptional regulator [Kribbella sp. VKM Ac-2566]
MSQSKSTLQPRVAGPSQTDVVVQSIRQMIIDGRLRPGDRLPIEKDLAAALGVSRNPLREGVRALSIMGVLETRQGDGTYVTKLDPSMLLAPMGFVVDLHHGTGTQHLHVVRRILETEAAALAAHDIAIDKLETAGELLRRNEAELALPDPDHETLIENDIAFHRIIAEAAGNPVLTALIDALGGRTMRDRLTRSIAEPGADETAHREHLLILAALSSHDPDRARTRMAAHLFTVEDYLLEHRPTRI